MSEQKKSEFVPDGHTFLNPYTFVSTPSRDGLGEAFGDAPPPGHDRLHERRWTGSLTVRLTVRTPLLLLDAARREKGGNTADEHFLYPLLSRRGKPHLPATSVKGMLRSAYEIVTNSRFGVFDALDEPLGWRRNADDAATMTPVRISDDGERIEFCEAAKVEMYPGPKHKLTHGQRVWAIVMGTGWNSKCTELRTEPDPASKRSWREGYAFVTGQNIDRKKHERVFFVNGKTQPLNEELKKRWTDLIDNYLGAHTAEELKKPPPQMGTDAAAAEWSRHLKVDGCRELTPGSLCYARTNDRKEIVALYPVAIPRDISRKTVSELLPEPLHPAPDFTSLSPADRLFGWVAREGSGLRTPAYRGRLRVGPVECHEPSVMEFGKNGMPLAILQQPKRSQGRFSWKATRPTGAPLTKEEIYGSADQEVRGRKVYWHHVGTEGDTEYWSRPADGQGADPTQAPVKGRYREFTRPRTLVEDDGPALTGKGDAFRTRSPEQRDSQNRSVRAWVNPGTEFTFRIDLRDVDDVELGALGWLLSLDDRHHHRLGLGKPLGFGAVRLSVDSADLHSGAQWAEYYRGLDQDLPKTDGLRIVEEAIAHFERHRDEDGLGGVAAEFLAVSEGVPNIPVHYPRVRPDGMDPGVPVPPDPRGRSYEWFTANEKLKGKTVAPGHGRSLPRPLSTDRLPLYKHKGKE
ncbi:TIGR03986 family CRISPR-associated RAMP protein [Actinocorallia sp. API 0066]|uniref:TIGR03986 family type III CRISPR-associated RAMP protein n=1 Tax=Actinocorallia sp. API 0066 TaxID=2896846 RepID=UPI001E2B83DE|nr:TIGR03986 family CRISPR-associated RAMP protein [Actinocorallia sp. API 0066]MCD0449398.1 TIGR03986 family CRISPR-associated RAMP protein [Actinocorallia sp. API 0066]